MAAQNVYGGLAQVGQLKAQVGLIISVCLAVSMCTSGAIFLKNSLTDKHTKNTSATVSPGSSACSSGSTCSAVASYTVDGKTYSVPGSWPVPLPSTTTIAYDPANPSDAEANPPSTIFGIILLAAACCVLVVGYITYQITMTYKPIAAVEGAGAIYNIGKATF